jgi:hypothetical protein
MLWWEILSEIFFVIDERGIQKRNNSLKRVWKVVVAREQLQPV